MRVDAAESLRSTVREVLLATDFSESADAAARVARVYAERFGARLHVLHVPWPGEYSVSALLTDLAESLRSAVPVVTAIELGDTAARIVEYARREGIDLIVMGTHGRTGATRVLLGSVAERVIRAAPCPVLTIPPGDAVTPADEPSALHRCLVCRKPSPDLICRPCRDRIRGKTLERGERAARSIP